MTGALAPTRRRTVMVVEDDRGTSDLLRDIVEDQGLRCVPASEGLIALEMALDERPSLITLDLDLPDTDGHRGPAETDIGNKDVDRGEYQTRTEVTKRRASVFPPATRDPPLRRSLQQPAAPSRGVR